jgi:hypothetical protein
LKTIGSTDQIGSTGDALFQELIQVNQEEIKGKFDFLCLFMHTFIVFQFKIKVMKLILLKSIIFFLQKSKQILKLAKGGPNLYEVDYRVDSFHADLQFKKTNGILKLK